MPRIKFTKIKIDGLSFTKGKGQQVIYWDTETPGLGLVVGARSKTFRVQIDIPDTSRKKGYRTVKKTLGRYGDITLEQVKAMMSGYVDENGRAVSGEKTRLKMEKTLGPTGEGITLSELVVEFYTQTRRRDGKERKETSSKKYQADIQRHFNSWLNLSLKQIDRLTPEIVMDRYQQISQAGPMAARLATTALSSVLNYGVAKYPNALQRNPLAVLKSRHVNVMEKIRARHESLVCDPSKQRNDFAVFYVAVSKLPEAQRDLHLFALYTGLRNMEASSLRWENVDLKHSELRLSDTKNRQDLHVPLSKQAAAILAARQEQASEGAVFVFEATGTRNKTGFISLHSSYLKKVTGLDITIHGLRRTFITIGRKLKRHDDTSRLTNHIDSTVEGRHYDETTAEDLRETAQLIGNTIERYLLDSKAIIIPFDRQQAA